MSFAVLCLSLGTAGCSVMCWPMCQGPSKVAPNFTPSQRKSCKATLVSYTSRHPSAEAGLAAVNAGVASGLATSGVRVRSQVNNNGVMTTTVEDPDPVVANLNRKCAEAIEQVLATSTNLPYIPRASVGLADVVPEANSSLFAELNSKFGITAPIRARFDFHAGFGWKKKVILTVTWEILSPQGEINFAAITEAESDSAEEVFPDTKDARYQATFMELARRNAHTLVGYLEK